MMMKFHPYALNNLLWHRDVWERSRIGHINRVKSSSKKVNQAWEAAQLQDLRCQRGQAIAEEILVLMSTFTRHDFFYYKLDNSWFIPVEGNRNPVWGQTHPPSHNLDVSKAQFAAHYGDAIPFEKTSEHFGRPRDAYVVGSEANQVALPDNLPGLFDAYFGLIKVKKELFYPACRLYYQACQIRSKSPSVSLLAAVSAIETLIPKESSSKCRTCGTPEAIEQCDTCGAPRYRITSQFKNLVTKYTDERLRGFADRVYSFRSGLSHGGRLLRSEFGDSGFTTGGKDDEAALERGVRDLTQAVLINWLIDQ